MFTVKQQYNDLFKYLKKVMKWDMQTLQLPKNQAMYLN